jgi:hypothetical protein
MRNKLVVAIAFASAQCAALCHTPPARVSSNDIQTREMHPWIEASSNGTELHLWAKLGSYDAIILEGSDTLAARVGPDSKESVPLAKVDLGGDSVFYETRLPSPPDGTPLLFALSRGTTHSSAPSSRAVLPKGFTIVGHQPEVIRQDKPQLYVRIDGVEGRVLESVPEGPCASSYGWSKTPITEGGTVTLDLGYITRHLKADCPLHVDFRVRDVGELDAAFGGRGTVGAAQVRSIDVLLKRG